MPEQLWKRRIDAVVIGASSGAVDALLQLLPALPASCAIPVIVVVHVRAEPGHLFEQLFRDRCALQVRETVDKIPLEPGIYFAPPDYHLLVDDGPSLSLSVDAPVLFSRPSIDVLFQTAAEAYGARLLGMVLTGANEDGAAGLRAVAEHGGLCCVQDPATALAAAMPRAALAACPGATVLSLPQLARLLRAAPQRVTTSEGPHD